MDIILIIASSILFLFGFTALVASIATIIHTAPLSLFCLVGGLVLSAYGIDSIRDVTRKKK